MAKSSKIKGGTAGGAKQPDKRVFKPSGSTKAPRKGAKGMRGH